MICDGYRLLVCLFFSGEWIKKDARRGALYTVNNVSPNHLIKKLFGGDYGEGCKTEIFA